MNKGFSLMIGLCAVTTSLGFEGLEPISNYSWNPNSPYVRVPKTLLAEVNFPSIRCEDIETFSFHVTPEFSYCFGITLDQANLMDQLVSDALDKYRLARSKHYVPIAPIEHVDQLEAIVGQGFSFRMADSDAEEKAIRGNLRRDLVHVLGEERAQRFWDSCQHLKSSEQGLGDDDFNPEKEETFTFTFREGPFGLEVEFRERSPGGYGAWRYPKTLDKYAPDSIKPIFPRWRKKMEETKADYAKQMYFRNPETRFQIPPFPPAKWDETLAYADLPKEMIPFLKISAVEPDGRLTDDAVSLFGLDSGERPLIDALYLEMNGRFEAMERKHVERLSPTELKFVVRPFPQEACALQEEWSQRLQEIAGSARGSFLEGLVRAGTWFDPRKLDRHRLMLGHQGPDWLKRGMAETTISITYDNEPRGPTQHIEYATEGGESGSFGGARGPLNQFEHLFTPDMLQVQKAAF